jgi:hypothetical protein
MAEDPWAEAAAKDKANVDAHEAVMSERESDGSLRGDPWYDRLMHLTGIGARSALSSATLGASDTLYNLGKSYVTGRPYKDLQTETQQFYEHDPVTTGTTSLAGTALSGGLISKGVGAAGKAIGPAIEEAAAKYLPEWAAKPAAAIGRGAAKLDQPGAAPVMANQAITGAGMAAGEDVGHGRAPNLQMMGLSALAGAGMGGLTSGAGFLLSPSRRLRVAGSEFNPEDVVKARTMLDPANSSGIQLNIPEAMAASDVGGRDAVLRGVYNTDIRMPKGSVEAARQSSARESDIKNTTNVMYERLRGGGGPLNPEFEPGAPVQQAAGDVVKNARTELGKLTSPDFAATANEKIPRWGGWRGPEYAEARTALGKDPYAMEGLKGVAEDSPLFQGQIAAKMGGLAQEAEKDPAMAASGSHAKLYRAKDYLQDHINQHSPTYAAADAQYTRNIKQAAEPIEQGPPGIIAGTKNADEQARALFGARTPQEGEVAQRAFGVPIPAQGASIGPNPSVGALPPGAIRGLLAHTYGVAKNIAPGEEGAEAAMKRVANIFPSKEGENVARGLLSPQDMSDLSQHLKIASAIRDAREPTASSVHSGDTLKSKFHNWLSNLAPDVRVKMLNDPKTLELFGKQGMGQRLINAGSTSAVNSLLNLYQFGSKDRP